jgi:hypothetical protein
VGTLVARMGIYMVVPVMIVVEAVRVMKSPVPEMTAVFVTMSPVSKVSVKLAAKDRVA